MRLSRWWAAWVACLSFGPWLAQAGTRAGGPYAATDDPVSAAAGAATASVYRVDQGAGDTAGQSADPAGTVLRHGYAGTLAETGGLTLQAATNAMGEGETNPVSAWAVMDDDTATPLAGGEPTWSVDGPPLAGVTTGLVTAASVYAAATGIVRAAWMEADGSLALAVRDTDPDNWGTYARDGLADGWQVAHFGIANPLAGPAEDGDSDTQNNLHEYTAGTDPTNNASRFKLGILAVNGQPGWMDVWFDPFFGDREYAILSAADLSAPVWTNETETIVESAGIGTLTDTNAAGPAKFYRVRIGYPAPNP